MNNQKGFISGVIGAVAGLAVVAWLHFYAFTGPSATLVGKTLDNISSGKGMVEIIAKSANASCPMQVDEITRIDSIGCPADNCLGYYYTLSDKSRSPQEDSVALVAGIPTIIEKLKGQQQLKVLASLNVTMIYFYRDQNGHRIVNLRITPDMYRE